MKKRLKEIVESDESLAGRVFNLFIIVLILLSVLSISLKTLPDLDESVVHFLKIFELVVVIIFTVSNSQVGTLQRSRLTPDAGI